MYNFELIKEIGCGSTGEVYIAKDCGNNDVVVKIMSSSKIFKSQEISFLNEISHLNTLHHKNIIKMIDNSKNNNHNDIDYIILEKMDYDLYDFIDNFKVPFSFTRKIFINICKAIKYCHSKNIAHLDIKPENILISKDTKHVKLCDFGGSKKWSKNKIVCPSTITRAYSAPEAKCGTYIRGDKADIWSLGVLLHVIYTNEWPFKATTECEMETKIINGNIHINSLFPIKYKSLILKMLSKNPNKRPKIKQILKSL